MRLEWLDGTPLYCRPCDRSRPHRRYRYTHYMVEAVQCPDGHVQHPLNAMMSMSVADDVDPQVLLLPQRDWSEPYVHQRYALLAKWHRMQD